LLLLEHFPRVAETSELHTARELQAGQLAAPLSSPPVVKRQAERAATVEDHEALEASAVVRELADAIEHEVDDLLADGAVAIREVVGGVLLAGDELAVGACADLVDHRLEVDEHGAGHGAGFREEGVEGVVAAADGLVRGHLPVRLDATEQMPFEGGHAEPAEDPESVPCLGVEVQPSSRKGCSSRSTTPPGKSKSTNVQHPPPHLRSLTDRLSAGTPPSITDLNGMFPACIRPPVSRSRAALECHARELPLGNADESASVLDRRSQDDKPEGVAKTFCSMDEVASIQAQHNAEIQQMARRAETAEGLLRDSFWVSQTEILISKSCDATRT